MKRLIVISGAALLLAGCANMITVRNPFSDDRVQEVYQCTRMAAGASVVVAFPQMMSDCPSEYGPQLYNILTVPLGVLCFADAICESVVDTVCLPFDIPISNKRNENKRREFSK